MILSTGILRVIGDTFPTIQLDVLASHSNASVLRNESYVHLIDVESGRVETVTPRPGSGAPTVSVALIMPPTCKFVRCSAA